VRIGDTLTVPRGRDVVVVRVLDCGLRRGPAPEAQALYEILDDNVLDPGAPRL
jgi:ribosome-associated heat shock protein Hsp15